MTDYNLQGCLPDDQNDALLVGRIWVPGAGPSIGTIRDGMIVDVTSRQTPTLHHLLERADPAAYIREASGANLGPVASIAENSSPQARNTDEPWLLSPLDLQAIKACGVTFVTSLLERIIEEQARGETEHAARLRHEVTELIGGDLSQLKPGSPEAMRIKQTLIDRGAWSQYLEVGIGPDPEVFTKAQPLSSVGHGEDIGIHPMSSWNNPEPEVVLLVNGAGRSTGATLGNDVNLRDIEGRSALLLGKAKDNNASCSIGPFIRLFDDKFSMDDVRALQVNLLVEGEDGFVLEGQSSMTEISRDPDELIAATAGPHHQYPDGFALFLGTMFAPVQDRDTEGQGFTHKLGDIVSISNPRLGTLRNRVRRCDECPPWQYGIADLMGNLAERGLI